MHDAYMRKRLSDVDSLVEKARHYYDPEGDRQRRLGFVSGASLLGAAGGAALFNDPKAKVFERAEETVGGESKRYLKVRGRNALAGSRNKAGLALMLLGGAGSLGAYRYGVSERNNTYR